MERRGDAGRCLFKTRTRRHMMVGKSNSFKTVLQGTPRMNNNSVTTCARVACRSEVDFRAHSQSTRLLALEG